MSLCTIKSVNLSDVDVYIENASNLDIEDQSLCENLYQFALDEWAQISADEQYEYEGLCGSNVDGINESIDKFEEQKKLNPDLTWYEFINEENSHNDNDVDARLPYLDLAVYVNGVLSGKIGVFNMRSDGEGAYSCYCVIGIHGVDAKFTVMGCIYEQILKCDFNSDELGEFRISRFNFPFDTEAKKWRKKEANGLAELFGCMSDEVEQVVDEIDASVVRSIRLR